jgi:sporulation protein YlmC with PRC-barrel domain
MIRMTLLGAGIASLGLLLNVPAQADDEQNEQNTTQTTTADETTAGAERSALQAGQLDRIRRGSELLDEEVENPQDEDLGTIEDIVIDRQGQAHYLVIGHGGVVASDRFIAIPWDVVKPNFDDEDIQLNMSEEKLKQAPYFTKSTYNDLWTTQWCEKVHTFFGSTVKSQDRPVTETTTTPESNQAQDAKRMFYASQLIGSTVQNMDEKKLATIDDLVFDSQGRVAYAILGHGGFLNIGENDIAVPWQKLALRAGEQGNVFATLDMTTEQLEKAPMLEKEDYADLLDASFATNANAYFGVGARQEIEAETPSQEPRDTENRKD